MIRSVEEADREMASLFVEAWEQQGGHPALYPNRNTELPKADTWANWELQYRDGGQRSFGPPGRRKFEKIGSIIISVFTKLGEGTASSRGPVELALGAYEGKRTPGGIAFTNCRIETEGRGELGGGNRAWWATIVVIDFNYFYLR